MSMNGWTVLDLRKHKKAVSLIGTVVMNISIVGDCKTKLEKSWK